MTRFGFYLAIIFVLTACSRPVVRGEKEPTTPAAPETKYERADLKKRLWVLPFVENQNPDPAFEGIKVGELLQPRLATVFGNDQSPFVMPESEQATLKELNIDSSMPSADVARLARGAGVTGFLRGEINTLDLKVTSAPVGLLKNKSLELKILVRYELFDSTSGRRIAAGNETQTYTETRSDIFGEVNTIPELDKKIAELATSMAPKILARIAPLSEKMGWEGKVLSTDSTRVYINAGRRTGIQVGDTLKVVERPAEIRDPQTGTYVGDAPGRTKGTLKVIQLFGLDGSIAVLQSGGGVRPGDRVELF